MQDQNEFLAGLGAAKANLINDWMADQSINDLAAYLRTPGTLRESYDGTPYNERRWVEILRIPGIGRGTVAEIFDWAIPEVRVQVEAARKEVEKRGKRLEAAKAALAEAKQSLSDILSQAPY